MKPTPGQYERYRRIFQGKAMPLAFIDLENFDKNVHYVAQTQKSTGKTIRVHTKSLRCEGLIKRIFDVGKHAYKGLMTFTMAETAFLADKGFDDFIVAYPTAQPSDLALLTEMTARKTKISLMIDSVDHLRILNAAGKKAGIVLKACLEVDMSYRPLGSRMHLGMRRSPVRTPEQAVRIAKESKNFPFVKINSIMGYEAHIASPNDAVPGQALKNAAIRALKKASIAEFGRRRADVVARLRQAGLDPEIVNGGGSGSLVSTGRDPAVTEVTAGSAFYAPVLFWHYKEVEFTPSAFFALQVVRKPAPNMITCLGGGYVASGAAAKDKLPVPVYPEGMKLLPLEGAGEVQTPLILPDDCRKLSLGDPVFFQHAKAGEIAERFSEFSLIEGENIIGKAKTYRGRGKTFL